MAVDLAKYVVSLEAETAKYTQQLQVANNKLEQFERRNTESLKRLDRGFFEMSNRFTMVASKIRSVFSFFGVAFGVRAFAGWIRDSIEVEKLTAQQAETIGRASKAANELKNEFQSLARTAVTELAPALEKAAKFWKEFFFPSGSQFGSGSDRIREQVDAQIEEVERLQRLLNTQTSGDANANWFQRFVFGDHSENISQTTSQLAAARAELERLRALLDESRGGSKSQFITQDELIRLETFIYELNQKPPLITQEELLTLEQFIHELNQRPPLITLEERIALEDFLNELNTVPERLTQEEWVDLESFIFELNHMKREANKTAVSMGDDFRAAFDDWMMGVDLKFDELLKKMSFRMATSALFKGLATMFGGLGTSAGNFLSDFFGGFRAEGGPLTPGKWYIAGEKGPEPVWGGGAGAFAMASMPAGGGGLNVTYNIDARGATTDLVQRLPAILRANNQQLKAEISDARRRGRPI